LIHEEIADLAADYPAKAVLAMGHLKEIREALNCEHEGA
jgi:hypothetical protein